MKKLVLVLVSIMPGFAQVPGNFSRPGFPAELKQYLGLSEAQAAAITALNMEYNRLAAEKSLRSAQVQGEIAEWTAKEPLEPMQLGLRYTELEVIRRQLRDALTRAREKTLALLDFAQKAKLKALEDAMKLRPLITQAQCQNLLVAPRLDPVASKLLPASIWNPMSGYNCVPQFVGDPLP